MKPREVLEKLKKAGWVEGQGREHAIEAISPTGLRVPIPFPSARQRISLSVR